MAKGELRKGRIRVSYIEGASIREALEKEAALTGVPWSTLVREATWRYVQSLDKDEPIRRDPTRVAKRNRKRD